MKIMSYSELSDDSAFFNFLKTESFEADQPARVNIWEENWKTNPHTLPYILTNTSRFDGINGEFFILYDNDEIVACGGVYISGFSKHIAIAGVRTWVKRDYRHLSLNKDYLLVKHKRWAMDRGMKMLALSFNEYNKNMIQIFKRNRLGESPGRITNREPKNIFYYGLHEVGFPVKIQYTPQWVIYEKLDNEFEFDWESLQ